jgi:hypothetical protein
LGADLTARIFTTRSQCQTATYRHNSIRPALAA